MKHRNVFLFLLTALALLAFICAAGAGRCLTAAVIIPGIPPLP
jgi:hypothetical protein